MDWTTEPPAALEQLPQSATDQPQSLAELLRHDPINLPLDDLVFCNRDLGLANIDVVGFDMDYTLALYKQEAMDALSVEKTLERLVSERGYPAEILSIAPRPDFAIRGLIVDAKRGNIFKMDSHRHVGKVFHGLKEASEEEVRHYRTQTIRLNHERYALVDTLFALPEAFLFAALVDYFETHAPTPEPRDWTYLYKDIRHCIDLAHRDDSLKSAIMADTPAYLERHQDLALTLHKLRSSGKRLFILTNSFPRFTQHVMSYLLDGVLPDYPTWRSYFDIVITGAHKPHFFTERAPFLKVRADESVIGPETQGFERNAFYQGGNLADFERMAGIQGDRVLFVGDHIYGDIMRSRRSTAWRTAMIVQEMEDELKRADQLRADIQRLHEIDVEMNRLNAEAAFNQGLARHLESLISVHATVPAGEAEDARAATSQAYLDYLQGARTELRQAGERLRRRQRELLAQSLETERHIESNFNPYWGLLFKQGNENSIFGEQVEDYACLYTCRVSNLLHYSPMHYFRSPRKPMAHERF